MDLDIQSAIEGGKRNLEAKELIHNWCQHARVEKFGGTGLIEMQTGLPIGHHSMACDYAPSTGMATYFLEASAVSFHDANCIGCPKRVPVRLPNISKLIAQRERDRERAQARIDEEAREKQAALQERTAVRSKLRETLPVLASTFLDDLQALDEDKSESAEQRLIESARLAPEILVPELMDHLYFLLESGQRWFDATGLTILSARGTDQERLTRCAMRCLAMGRSRELAALIVAARIDLVDARDVFDAVSGLAYVASRPRPELPHGERAKDDPGPLLKFSVRFPDETARGLDELLSHSHPFHVGIASRAIGLLVSADSQWAKRFLRPLAAQLSRADIVIDLDRDSQLRKVSHDLQQALAKAFMVEPDLADSELMRQFESASAEGEGRLAGVYEYVVKRMWTPSQAPEILRLEPYEIALRRLVDLGQSSKNHEVTFCVLNALRHPDKGLLPVTKQLVDLLLGSAAVIDSTLKSSPSESVLLVPPNAISSMDLANRRSYLWSLRRALIALAVHGAGLDSDGLAAFESLLAKRGMLGDSLEAAIIQEMAPLMESNAGLRALLPYLYGAMVGPSTLGRASAAIAIEEIGRVRFAELPDLVSEALLLMLFDPYVIVHKAAVRTLRRITLPAPFRRSIAPALENMIAVYRGGDDQEFLLDCVEAFCREKRDDEHFLPRDGRVVVALLSEMSPSVVLRSGHFQFVKTLGAVEGYVPWVLSLFPNCRTEYEVEYAIELVQEFPPSAAAAHLESVLKAIAPNPSDPKLCGTFVELLTRDGEWAGAVQVAKLRADVIPATIRNRERKLYALQLQWRAEFEHLVSQGRLEEAHSLRKAWDDAEREIGEIREHNEKSDPFRRVLSTPPSQ